MPDPSDIEPQEISVESLAAQQGAMYAMDRQTSMYAYSQYALSMNAPYGEIAKSAMYAYGGVAQQSPMGQSMVRPAFHSFESNWNRGLQRLGDGAPPLDRPLRVAHLNAALIPAGIEYWLASLRRYANPKCLEFIRTVILTDWVDTRQVSRMGMPVEVGGRESVVAAASQCDVLLVSDPGRHSAEVAQWILSAKPALVVFVAHGDGPYTATRMAGIGSAVDHIVAVTDHVRKEVCGDWPVSVILNGVDPHRLVRTRPREAFRRSLGFAADDFVVGFVGRFSEEKNPHLLIDAVEQLPLPAKLLLVGHGCMEDELVRRCRERLPGRFVILEGDGDLGDLYAAMDTFVMPSRLEGYGLVAMEAMMAGVPVVATPFGMIADLVTDHVHAMVVEPHADAIAGALHKLARYPQLRQLIIEGGKQLAEQTGYASQMASQYEQLLVRLWTEATRNGHADR